MKRGNLNIYIEKQIKQHEKLQEDKQIEMKDNIKFLRNSLKTKKYVWYTLQSCFPSTLSFVILTWKLIVFVKCVT